MSFGRPSFTQDYGLAARGVVFDPMSMTLAATAVGGALSAGSTLAGGAYAKKAGELQKQGADFQAAELEQNAGQAKASAQRTALDTGLKTKLAMSASRARAAGSGVDAGTGSPVNNQGELAERGSYHALMDMFNGESTAAGLADQARGVRFSGDLAELEGKEKRNASYLSAAGTLAGTAGSMFSTYGRLGYPTTRGASGANI